MYSRVIFVDTKLLNDVLFVEVVVNADAHIYHHLRDDKHCKQYGERLFQDLANIDGSFQTNK